MLHYNLTVGNYDKPVCPDSCTTFSVVIGCLGWDMAILGRPPGLPIPMGVSCPPLKPFSLGQPGNRNFQHFTALHLNLLLWQFFQQSYDNWKYWAPCPSGAIGLRPPRGSIELIFTEPINPVSLEQFHHKPTGMWQLRETTSIQSHRFVKTFLKVKSLRRWASWTPVVALKPKT